jgi:CubicO group peptidase (beta-lactamase class C family)
MVIPRALAIFALTLLFIQFSSRQPKGQTAQSHTQTRALEERLEKSSITRLEQIIPHLMAEGDIPGLSIALIRDGGVAWSRGFGVKNSETKDLVDDSTVFEAASLSKPVFAYAVLKLVDSGKLSLDTPLTKYLPGRYDVGDDPRLDQITARRVLTHTSGFPNWRPRGDTSLKIHFTPGDRFSYSGEGFVYLARAIEHITGETLDALMKSTVFDPLGMNSSSYLWQDGPKGYLARKTFAHNSVGSVSGRGKPERANAAASLHTTATDYARFVVAIIKGTGLKPETARLMITPQISVAEVGSNTITRPDPKLSKSISWGLGWGLEETENGTAFWHWGDNGDMKAYVVAFSKQKTGMVMFANSANGLSIVNDVVENALGGQHPSLSWVNIERYNSPARLMFKAILKSDAETVLSEYRKGPQEVCSSKVSGDSSTNGPHTNTNQFSTSGSSQGSQSQKPRLTEAQMNSLGYQLLGLKRVKDAIEVFKQNTVDFPEAFNTWDSLAEGFMISGDKESAIKYYKKSLELNPDNTNAVQKLKELNGPAS